MILSQMVKGYAYELGADLVGIGSIDRCAHAPIMMSPQGVFPGAQTVIVMGIHHPDACIELGGEQHPQEIGPYSVQYLMNSRLDEMAYRMATFIEKSGYGAIPIASSNIWRYNQYKDLKAIFAPDVSNIYMPVLAGLADMGFNGLALTPEYGARNRFITIITDAVIEADPMIPPGTVCDQCMLCRKHCPSKALSKEICGDKVLKIGNYEYHFPNKNLWRCAWGEHFDLDLDLEIPDVVTEQVILDNVQKHGIRSGEMGQCLKFCVPKTIRTFDRSYSKTPMRIHWAVCDEAKESRAVIDRLLSKACQSGVDEIIVHSAVELKKLGFDLETVLPGAVSSVTMLLEIPAEADCPEFSFGAQYQIDSLCYDLTRELETLGFRSLMGVDTSGSHPDAVKDGSVSQRILSILDEKVTRRLIANTVVTRKTIAPQRRFAGTGSPVRFDAGNASANITAHMIDLAKKLGADLTGVANSGRIDQLVDQLRPVFDGETLLKAKDNSVRFKPWDPEVSVSPVRVVTATDHLPGAQSVLVFGLRLHKKVLQYATRPPAEAVGPYAFQTYITSWLGSVIGFKLVKRLKELGYKAVMTMDITGTDSVTATPRGMQPDIFSNRFAGVAAGLGKLTVSGHLTTPEFGIRQRLIAIVTDAPLDASPLPASNGIAECCAVCAKLCISTCPSKAISAESIKLECAGQRYAFNHKDGKRCDWVKRYALMGESGFKYLGSITDVPAPVTPTPSELTDALRRHDPIKKYRPVVAEPCVINCPLAT
jgi:epoxyqueuosine reductase QueG